MYHSFYKDYEFTKVMMNTSRYSYQLQCKWRLTTTVFPLLDRDENHWQKEDTHQETNSSLQTLLTFQAWCVVGNKPIYSAQICYIFKKNVCYKYINETQLSTIMVNAHDDFLCFSST